MNNLNPQIIAPIIAIAMLFGQRILNIQFSNEDIQTITDGLLSVVALIGVFIHPKKPTE